jgi:hypothetical protein
LVLLVDNYSGAVTWSYIMTGTKAISLCTSRS